MTREEAITDYIVPAIKRTWNDKKCKEILEALEQEPKWIPVSERLPEDEQEILFSTKTGRVHSGKYHDDDSANQWYSHRDKCRAWNNVVSAWMPLPEPYKVEPQESEDKE